ncbi:hypothetical protein ACQKNS_17295 [Peribacillus sp. NPDC094092]|uniref:hypothetical protein n=1 Tax=Peribacillus sp. NPDC094092 TaxID=3390611 RepID=UPI003D021FE0
MVNVNASYSPFKSEPLIFKGIFDDIDFYRVLMNIRLEVVMVCSIYGLERKENGHGKSPAINICTSQE